MTVAGSAASLTKAINDTVKELAVTQASMNTKVTAIQANQATAATQKTTAEGYRDTAATNATAAAASLATVKSTVVMDGIPAVSGSKMGTAVDTFIYDTSLDSDGGAWRKRCQHTSWFNETITGKWLGAHDSEFQARNIGSAVGSELVSNGNFSGGATGWTTTSWVVANGVASIANVSDGILQNVSLVAGRTYRVEFTLFGFAGTGGIRARFLGGTAVNGTTRSQNGTYVEYIVAGASNSQLTIATTTATCSGSIDNVSVREVTALTTASNDYFQLTTDGKFYRLWKNLFQRSQELDNTVWEIENDTLSANTTETTAPDGTNTAEKMSELTNTNNHFIRRRAIFTSIVGAVYTLSIYVKKGTRDFFSISDDASRRSWFNIASGTVGTVNAGHTAAIASVGNGWYRCSITFAASTASMQPYFYANTANNQAVYAGSTSAYTYIWGAQFEFGYNVGAYEAKTVDGPITEVFRGNRREFPVVALVVAEATKVTIYDADDLTLPMWMVFVAGQTSSADFNWMLHPSGTITSVTCLNGTFCVGRTGTWARFVFFNFLVEKCQAYGGGGVSLLMNGPVSKRNAALGASQFAAMIANDNVNDVAMTVLPNAPIDAATGLPVPTIAVATLGGVSVIKHDGSIVSDSTLAHSPNSSSVKFDTAGVLWITAAGNHHFRWDSPYASSGAPEIGESMIGSTLSQWTSWVTNNKDYLPLSQTERALPHLQGLTLFDTNRNLYMTTKYNTGWMLSNTKGAFLANTIPKSLISTGLINNANFDTDTTGWSFPNDNSTATTTSVTGGVLTYGNLTNAIWPKIAGGGQFAQPGCTYKITITVTDIQSTDGSPSTTAYVDVGTVAGRANKTITAPGSYDFIVTNNLTTSSAVSIIFSHGDLSSISITSITATDVEEDRSYTVTPLAVIGPITRAPVATGAQLVGYAGFTGSNYLEQAYSSALDFGTGDFCVMTWGTEFGTWRSIFSRTDSSTNAPLLVLEPSGATNQARVFINSVQYMTNFSWFSGTWKHIAMVRTSGVISLYLDGVLQSSFTAAGTVNGTLPLLRIAMHSSVQGSGAYSQGSLALFRISATAPTTNQIKRIYEDELRMFQPGAACTLYGTSDAVTGLAYDPKTNLLHAGTSSGRSVFDGLVRVANTTTPVTTAISAVNGLIAEQ